MRKRRDLGFLAAKIARNLREGGPSLLAYKALQRLPGFEERARTLAAKEARDKLARARPPTWDLARSLDFAYAFLSPAQIREEIQSFLEILQTRPPRTVLEIGTAHGGTLFLLAQVAQPDALIISVDLPHGDFGGGYTASRENLYRAFARPSQRLALLRSDSHRPSTLEAVRNLFGDLPVDVLFIDGDHTFEGVRRDYEMYSTLVGSDGLIAFHDIVPGPAEYVGGVPNFWKTLRGADGILELVRDWEQGAFGIGVLRAFRVDG
jgi:predicted O-methyltransferase YrrM